MARRRVYTEAELRQKCINKACIMLARSDCSDDLALKIIRAVFSPLPARGKEDEKKTALAKVTELVEKVA